MNAQTVDHFSTSDYATLFDRVIELKARRDELEERIAAGDIGLVELFALADVDKAVATTKVLGLVEAMPQYKKVQTRRAFGDLGISEAAHVGHVTERQREALAAALASHQR